MAESYAERKRRLDNELVELRRAMKLCKKESKALARDWILKEDMKAVVICTYILADMNLEPAVAYLRGIGRIWHFSDLDDDNLAVLTTDIFSHASDDELNVFTDPTLTPFPDSLVKAHSLVHTWRAKEWTAEHNRDGDKVATPVIHMHAERELEKMPSTVRPESWGAPGTNRSKMLFARMRKQYNGRYGQLPVVGELTTETMRAKATAVWQWYNYYRSQRPAGKALLHINWDETAICLHQNDKKGNIFLAKGHDAVQRVSHGARRAYLTHVALVCDAPLIQERLPQIVICNERTLPAKMHAALQEHLGDNIILLRRKSAWVNEDVCLWILRQVREALGPLANEWQVILMVDALKSHISVRMFNAGARLNIWILVIPAGMTWLLQVLDTHGFRSYKAYLRSAYQVHSLERGPDADKLQILLDSVKEAINVKIRAKDWSAAFAENGFGPEQYFLRDKIKKQLSLALCLEIPSSKPSLDQIRLCFPRRTRIPYNAIWRSTESVHLSVTSVPISAATATSCYASSASSSAAVIASAPIASRTRAKAKASST